MALALLGGAEARGDKPTPQVLIEARFVEASRSFGRELGFDWQRLDGEPATFTVGGEVPLGPRAGTGPVEFDPVVLELKVTPTLSPGGLILMDLGVNVDDVDGSPAAPEIAQRTASTRLEVRDGQTAVVSGLLQTDAASLGQRVPVLNDLPILGQLFRSKAFQNGETDLFILLEATLGGSGSRPVRQVPGLDLVLGGSFGLGFYDADGDGDQHSVCDARLASDPNTNVCDPAIQDFALDTNFSDSGFDWRFGLQVGLEYDLASVWKGLTADLGYSFDYVGVSRIELPTNLDVDGPPDIERRNEPRHSFGMTFRLDF